MSENAEAAKTVGAVVARDTERFKRLFKNGRPVMPADYSAPLTMKPIRTMIREIAEGKTGE